MFKQNNFKKLTILLVIFALSNYVIGQNITNYAFTATSGTFTAITGGTSPTLSGSLDDGYASNIPIGFTFYYMGLPYTTLAVSTNGFVSLGGTMSGASASNALSSGTPRPILAPLWDDLEISTATDVSYVTSGSNPSRVFTMQWNNVLWNYYASTASIAFQVKLYEETGAIDFVYKQLSGSLNSASASIGITAVETGSGKYLSLNGSGTAPEVSSTTETTSISAKPTEGQTYTFTPPAPPAAPTNLTFTNISGASMTLNWSDNSSSESGFAIYKSLDGTNFTFASSTAPDVTTYIASGLSFSTTYYWRVFAFTEGALSDFIVGSEITTAPTLSGTKYIGMGTYSMDYATLTDAFTAVNNNGLAGNLILILNTAYTTTETTFPITTPLQSSQGNYTITIYPSVSGLTITSAGTSTFSFDGAKNITIDGRAMATGTEKDLTIENTLASGQALLFKNDASNNMIKYCKVEGRNTSATSGVIVFAGTTGTTGNDFNTIDNCDLSSDGTNYPTNILYSSGTSTKENDNITISNCNVFDFFSASTTTKGILFSSNTTQCSVTNNSFYQTASRTFTSGVEMRAISIENSSGNSFVVTNNYIGSDAALCAGTNPLTLTSATLNHKFTGIYINVGTTTASSVSGNTISNVVLTGGGTSSQLQGIYNNAGVSPIVNNTISNLSLNSANTSSGSSSSVIGINQYSTSIIAAQNISQNTIFNLKNETTTAAVYVIGIYYTDGGTAMPGTVQRNNIYNLSTKSTGAAKTIGIQIGNGSGRIINNMICIGNDNENPNEISGIFQSSGTDVRIYFNSIYIGGTTSGTSVVNSFAFQRNQTGQVCELKNNILVNNRTGSDGKHYALKISNITDYTNLKANNNIYLNSNSSNLILQATTTPVDYDFGTWVSTTNLDLNSFNSDPQFLAPEDETPDLHLSLTNPTNAESSGIKITTPAIAQDFDDNLRWSETGYTGTGISVDIGADEFEGIPLFTCPTTAPGNTVSNASDICLGQSVTLSLENTLSGSGLTFQWKSSTNGTDYTDITNATSSTYTITPLSATYFKCTTTCMNGPTTHTSTPLLIDYANKITSVTGATECGPTQVQLLATASNGTINWYDTQTGGNLIGTGSPFTITALTDTTFYVAAETITPTTITIGANTANQNSTTSYPAVYGNYYKSSKHQLLFLASELSAAGLTSGDITSLSFDVTSVGTLGILKLFTIKMANTTQSALTSTLQTTGFTEVVQPIDYQAIVGVNTHTFSQPFNWDGTSNIIVDICFNNIPAGLAYTSNAIMNRTATTFNSVAYLNNDSNDQCPGSTSATISTNRPNITFAGMGGCKSGRTEVNVTITPSPDLTISSNTTVCNNSVATLSVTAGTSDYDSFIWTPSVNLFTDLACTTPYTGGSATTVYVKTSITGEYIYTCTSENIGSGCSNIKSSTVSVLPASVTISPENSSLCTNGIINFTVSPSSGYGNATFQWKSTNSYPPTFYNNVTNGGTTLNYTTLDLTETTYYQLKIKAGAVTCVEALTSVTVYNPLVTNTIYASRCGTGTVTLQAEAEAGVELNWFDAETVGNFVGTGSTFTTPVIETTTNYYVEARVVFDDILAGRISPIGTNGNNYSGYGLVFNTESDIILNSVDVYPTNTSPAAITIKLYDNTGAQVAGTSNVVFTPIAGTGTTAQTVELNYAIPAGIDYRLVISGGMSSSNKLVEENTGITYPIQNSPIQITSNWNGTSTNTTKYSWFYNWNVTPVCYGAGGRVQVPANVNEAPAFSVTGETQICDGESTILTASSIDNPNYNFVWMPGNITNAELNIQPLETTTYTVTATDNSGGTYDACSLIQEITINVNPIPDNVTASASEISIAFGTTIDLFSSPGSGTFNILEEDFNETTNNWTTTNTSTGTNPLLAAWTLKPDGYSYGSTSTIFHSNDNSQFFITNSDAVGSGAVVATTLESPSFSTQGLVSCYFSFYHYYRSSGSAKIEAFDGITWTTLKTYTSTQGAENNFVKDSVDLIDYINKPNVKVRFAYNAGWGWYWAIDNVKVVSDNPDFTYTWTSIPIGYTSDLQNPEATPLENTTFSVAVTNPITGCSASASVSVIVGEPLTDNDILTFNIQNQIGETLIDVNNHTVVVEMHGSTDVTSLIPEITISDFASISPESGDEQDFTNPVNYTVTAPSSDEQIWVASVIKAPVSGDFSFVTTLFGEVPVTISQDGSYNLGNISGCDNLETFFVEITDDDLDITDIFDVNYDNGIIGTLEYDATEVAWEFIPSVELDWTVGENIITSSIVDNDELTLLLEIHLNYNACDKKDIMTFNIPTQISTEISTENSTVAVVMPNNTDVTALIPTTTVSQNATISPESGVQQNFSSPVTYTVMAENGTTKDYLVTVTLQTGINTIEDDGISIYPNPSSGIFYISVDKVYTLKVSDLTGKLLFTKELKNTDNSIDLSNYASGVYNIILSDENTIRTYKIFIND